MTSDLLHLYPGVPFVVDGQIYYREFETAYNLIKCFPVINGVVRFKEPKYFDKTTSVQRYEFKHRL